VNKPYEFQTIAVPEPKGRDILVKVGAASFCHTDALALDGSWPVEKPCTGSHEGAGTIVKLGPDVPKGKFKVGDRVGLHCFYHVCGKDQVISS
jgi:alcohol dehydrogenase, propanol-preferring